MIDQEDLVKSIKSLKKYLKRMKPTDEYVRGYIDAKVMIDKVLIDVIEVLKDTLYCELCNEHPRTHSKLLSSQTMNYIIEVCDECKGSEQ
jgi:hypothetical protein